MEKILIELNLDKDIVDSIDHIVNHLNSRNLKKDVKMTRESLLTHAYLEWLKAMNEHIQNLEHKEEK